MQAVYLKKIDYRVGRPDPLATLDAASARTKKHRVSHSRSAGEAAFWGVLVRTERWHAGHREGLPIRRRLERRAFAGAAGAAS